MFTDGYASRTFAIQRQCSIAPLSKVLIEIVVSYARSSFQDFVTRMFHSPIFLNKKGYSIEIDYDGKERLLYAVGAALQSYPLLPAPFPIACSTKSRLLKLSRGPRTHHLVGSAIREIKRRKRGLTLLEI
jgi:hypothetical protein